MTGMQIANFAVGALVFAVLIRTVNRGHFSFYRLPRVTKKGQPVMFWLLILVGAVIVVTNMRAADL